MTVDGDLTPAVLAVQQAPPTRRAGQIHVRVAARAQRPARAQRSREYKKKNAQPLQSDEAQKGSEQGRHASEISCLFPRQLKGKR